MRLAWIGGRIIPADQATLPLEHPAVRWGEGLMESMRAEGGRVALLDRHLGRLAASAEALAIADPPPAATIHAAIGELLAALPAGSIRLRLTAGAHGLLAVEGWAIEPMPDAPAELRAVSIRGAWSAANAIAEHKTTSYLGWRVAARRAAAAGADLALLLDADGRLGEADAANVIVVRAGVAITPPARGLLAGVARAVLRERHAIAERDVAEVDWRGAHELIVVNAVHGARAVVAVDGAPLGEGTAGPVAHRLHAIMRTALTGEH